MRKIQIPNDNFTDNENKSKKLKAKKINHAPHFFFFRFEETPLPGKRTLWAQVSE
jgi:hypothetical protein